MREAEVVDARGRSCPEPVLMTKRRLESLGKGQVLVLVDNGAARDNVTRLANHLGWQVRVETAEGEFRLHLNKD